MIRRQPWGQLRGQFGRFAAERGFLDDALIHGQLARYACKRTFGNGAGEACSAWPPEVWHSKTGLRNDYFGKILNHEAPIPLHFNFAKDVFAAHAMDVATGDSDALVHVAKDGTETRLSFHDLLEWSQKIARFLKEDCGFQPMNRVIVILPRIPEWWALNLAAIQCGVLLIPGTVQLTSSDIAKRLLTAEAHGVICSQETLARVQEALEKRSPAPVHRLRATIIAASSSATTDPTPLVPPGWKVLPGLQDKDLDPLTGYFPSRSGDPCNLFFTSGTTGLPKLTLVNHVSYGMGHWGTGRLWLNSGSEDLVWNLSDTGWAKAAYSSFYSPWIACATVFSAEVKQTLYVEQF
ncbi:unnamed protein product [Notodromas monacha]|uniref:medium-chain acyl-CoA ligase n=1 Tax=Notodromas monacha TaxID=399045 RepID=A0A7R9BVR9_9CRUS|nr:unnamed protein product [Notodromas monacha]CAG0921021.1 unnamed protein product [Notodromas monacha]